jgi:tetratricopeptide (TPR) repeat protein
MAADSMRSLSWLVLAVTLGATLGLARVALAQQAAPQTAAADRERLKTLFIEGARLYSLGKFEEAAAMFEKVYVASGQAPILFNIAQAHRLAKNHERAAFFYKSFLRSNPPNRAEVEKYMAEETALLEKETREKEATAAAKQAQQKALEQRLADERVAAERERLRLEAERAARQPPPEKPPPRAFKYAGVALLAVGVGLVAVGGAMSGLAAGESSDVQNAAASSMGKTPFGSSLQHEEKNGRLYDDLSYAGYVVGGAAVVTGAALLAVGLKKPVAAHARLVPSLSPSQAGLALVGEF